MTVESTGASSSQMMLALMSLPLQGANQNLQELQKTIEAFQKSQESTRDLLTALERQNQMLSDRVTQLEASLTQERAAHQKVHEAVQQGLAQLQINLEKSAQGSQTSLQVLRQEFATFKEGYARHVHLPLPPGPMYPECRACRLIPWTEGGQPTPKPMTSTLITPDKGSGVWEITRR